MRQEIKLTEEQKGKLSGAEHEIKQQETFLLTLCGGIELLTLLKQDYHDLAASFFPELKNKTFSYNMEKGVINYE